MLILSTNVLVKYEKLSYKVAYLFFTTLYTKMYKYKLIVLFILSVKYRSTYMIYYNMNHITNHNYQKFSSDHYFIKSGIGFWPVYDVYYTYYTQNVLQT